MNVYIPVFLDRTKERINIDIGFGDNVYPDKTKLNFPTLIDSEPELYAYSIETVVAEKFEAIVSLGMLNSRLKDFYDIYTLSKTFDFDGDILSEAIKETFHHRGTSFDHIDAFDDDFISPYRKEQWNRFIRQKNPGQLLELEMVIEKIKAFISPIVNDDLNRKRWDHSIEGWKQI